MKKRQYMNWTPQQRGAVRTKLQAGKSLAEIAEDYGISLSALQKVCAEHGLTQPSEDLMLMTEFAELAGLTVTAASRVAKTAGLKITKWARYRVLPRAAAERVLADRPSPADAAERVPSGYYTVPQLAQLWSLDQTVIYRAVAAEGTPYQWARPGASRRFTRCYHLADVEHLKPTSTPVPLRGVLTTQQLAEALHVTEQGVWALARKGMPKLEQRTRQGAMQFRPAQVAEWLAARRDPRTRRKGERLLRELGLDREAAE